MKHKGILFFVIALLVSISAYSQTEPELSIVLLENDLIADVNIDQDSFINAFANITNLTKEEFQDIEESQKIAILYIAHKEGNPTIELYSNPKMGEEQEELFLNKLKSQPVVNTKLVDFPLLILVNSEYEYYDKDFDDFITPSQTRIDEYVNADLHKQYELNKEYAIEVITVLAAYQVIVDDKFEGVRNFGQLVTETNFKEKQNIEKITSENSDFWRAIMEMSIGNQLIPITKIFIMISQGEIDHAMKYIEIIRYFSDPESISDMYLSEMSARLDVFNEKLYARIQEGISFHDKGEYNEAIAIYEAILQDYPHSAWAKYELFYSKEALAMEKDEKEIEERSGWDIAKPDIYKSNPLYNMDVRASNGKEGYLLYRRSLIAELFKDRDNMLSDIYKYADIALDLGVYDFAAQLFWLSFTFDKDENDAVFKLLYCLEKLNVTDLKVNFKGDFDKEFKKIEKEKKKEMTSSPIYKAFEN